MAPTLDIASGTQSDLKRRIARGAFVTSSAQVARLLLQVSSAVVLSRLLAPGDFGLVGMVSAVTGFLLVFRDAGLGAATIQAPTLSWPDVSALFWVNTGIGVALAAIAATSAPALVWFFGDRRLGPITIVLASAFIFGGAAVQHQAVLRRQMRFGALAANDLISSAVGASAGIIWAALGGGYWALAASQVAMAVTAAVGVWAIGGWCPTRPKWTRAARKMSTFGANLTVFSFLNYFSRNADNLLIGKFCGAHPLGLYSRAYQLLVLPQAQVVAPMGAVAVPLLSRLQDDPRAFAAAYLRCIRTISYATVPLVGLSAAIAPDLILTVLGPNWSGTAPIYRLLTVPAMLQPILATTGWVFVARGRARAMANWGFASSILIVTAFVIGLPWGVTGVAGVYAFINVLLYYPCFAYAVSGLPIRVSDVTIPCLRASCLAASMAAAALATTALLPLMSGWCRLLASCAVGLSAGLLIALTVSPIRSDLWQTACQFKLLKSSGGICADGV